MQSDFQSRDGSASGIDNVFVAPSRLSQCDSIVAIERVFQDVVRRTGFRGGELEVGLIDGEIQCRGIVSLTKGFGEDGPRRRGLSSQHSGAGNGGEENLGHFVGEIGRRERGREGE